VSLDPTALRKLASGMENIEEDAPYVDPRNREVIVHALRFLADTLENTRP
jgi:hypothetical protein